MRRLAVIGGGPAGLMAAETARAAGLEVAVFERMASAGRKFLLAGKGGLNLTHSEPRPGFDARYGARREAVAHWLDGFDASALRAWAAGLGIATFTGSSGRVFPADMKAAPLLRAWLKRLRERGVAFHLRHDWQGWDAAGALRFATPDGPRTVAADAVVLALGGASWPQLGARGDWAPLLAAAGADLAPLEAANAGFEIAWSAHLRQRFAGAALKAVVAHWQDTAGAAHARRGECVVSEYGIEGSLIYALGADMRALRAAGHAPRLTLDLAPDRAPAALVARLAAPRGRHSLGDWLRRRAGLDKLKCALVFEQADPAELATPERLARRIKALPLALGASRPVAEAISSAGGVRLESLDVALMLRARPGLFLAGEMLDWDAPTGGYLLSACFASGRHAALGAAGWLSARPPAPA